MRMHNVHICTRLHALSSDYQQLSQIDCNNVIEVDGDWLLSGTRKVPAPNIKIVTASLPSDGDYTAYIIAGAPRGTEGGGGCDDNASLHL